MPFEHLDAVLSETAPLAARFTDAGHRLYLVGGIVRDLWLGVPVGDTVDIDLTTEATPDQIKAIVGPWADAVWLQGERFGTIGLQSGDRSFEITTHRGEVYASDSRKPDVVFGDDVRVDLSRRDFTVNAMAIRIDGGSPAQAAGELVDPFEAVADLRGQVLRTPLDPRVSFSDDPLRILRAARFMARFGLVADADLVVAAQELAHRLEIVAAERSRDELEKLLGGADINTGLRFLTETGALEQVMPWFAGAPELQAAAAAQACALPSPWWLRLSALLMAGVAPQSQRAEVVAERARLVKCSTATSRAVLTVAKATWAGERLAVDATTVAPVRAWLQATMPYSEEAIVLAEMAGHHTLAEAARSLIATDDAWCADLPVDGGALIQAFDLEPGPMVGQLLRAVQEAQFSEGVLTRDRALDVASAALARLVEDPSSGPEGG